MAPGACGVYKDFLYTESVIDVMRKKVHNQERHRDGKRTHGGDLKFGSQRVCKDIEFVKSEKRCVINTFDLNDRNRNRNMHVGSLVMQRFADLESGELCSEDSSGIEDEFLGQGDASLCRKRKFSLIERGVDKGKKNSNCRQHSSVNSKSSEPSSTKKVKKSEDLLADRRISADIMEGLQFDNGYEPGQMAEDRGAVSTISLSRWANAYEDDEGATSDVEKCMLLGSVQDQKLELGEVVFRDGSERSTSNVSSSGGQCLNSSVVPVKDGNGDMDVYEESNIENGSESLEEDCKAKTLDNAESPCRSVNMLQACRSVDDFDKLNKINEGAYGIVYRARDKKSGEIVALKKVKIQKEREGFPLTSLREINILLSLHHHSIVEINEVVVGRDLDDIFIVMEYMEHDLKGLLGTMKKPFHLSEVKCLMLQLLSGVKHLHDNWVLHRDLKTSNLLFNNRGELKICDFGLSRHYGSPLKPYTKLVVTLWYRAPELLLGANEYSTAIDMWSVGCVMAELLNKEPLFPGKSELDQLDKIFKILGTPDEDTWPGLKRLPGAKVDFVKKPFKLHEKFPRLSPKSFLDRPMLSVSGFNLLNRLLTYDPEERITAEDALDHPWFRESPLPMSKDFMPTFPAQYRKARHQQRFMKSPYPLKQIGQKDSQYLGVYTSLDESVESKKLAVT